MIESKEVDYIFCSVANDNAPVSHPDFLVQIRFTVLGIASTDPPNPFQDSAYPISELRVPMTEFINRSSESVIPV